MKLQSLEDARDLLSAEIDRARNATGKGTGPAQKRLSALGVAIEKWAKIRKLEMETAQDEKLAHELAELRREIDQIKKTGPRGIVANGV